MVKSRASVFDNTPDIDLSTFTPKPRPEPRAPNPEQVRAVSEAANFRSREASPPAFTTAEKSRAPRRYRTGRNVQLNIKASQETVADFYAITDAHEHEKWSLGDTFEQAIAALKRELEKKRELEQQP
jgi:hypothetical protein